MNNPPMWTILKQLLKSAIRIEKKLDETLRDLSFLLSKAGNGANPRFREPFNYGGQSCPLCQKPVMYKPVQVTVPVAGSDHYPTYDTILVRVCGCVPETKELPIDEGELS